MVRGSSLGQETSLARTNDMVKEGLDPIHNDFGYQLISGVTEANVSIIREGGRIPTLGDETNEGFIIFRGHGATRENSPAEFHGFSGNHIPIFLEEEMVEVILSRGL